VVGPRTESNRCQCGLSTASSLEKPQTGQTQGQIDVFQRRIGGQQRRTLKDEADLGASEPCALAVAHVHDILPQHLDLPGVGAI